MKLFSKLFLVFFFFSVAGFSQSSTYIDNDGILRYTTNDAEFCAFGTNYNVPFSYWSWRQAIGADQYKAIDEDVYHIARLGLDGFRIHVWDVFISDSLGNLTYNEHFKLYDYLQYKLKQRGIKMYITPMNLFTDVDGGFAAKYGGKSGCLGDSTVFPVMENYLKQFFNHVNPYTGVAYKNDPDIVAVEIVNEPAHWKNAALVKPFINRMFDAIRSTGCEKPIFYNMTTCADLIEDVLQSKAEGASFQWYPSGLTSNHNLNGNMLPNVDKYYIPFDNRLKQSKRPKFVYEFSPADIGASASIYPAMARSFREAGIQFAAQFAYDPLHAAYCNIEYRTHFLNLVYTPSKAIGLMIASEVFHSLPLNNSYGRYPKNNRFESFRIDPDSDLAEMVTEKKFLYTKPTETRPPAPEKLEQIAGTGNSLLVKYSGTGAYFLDKLEDGVWRLEVMPDAHWVADPFFVPHIYRETAVTVSRNQKMTINLPDLGEAFGIEGINPGNKFEDSANHGSLEIEPGVYILSQHGKSSVWQGSDTFKTFKVGEYHSSARKLEKTYLLHSAPYEIVSGNSFKVSAKVIAPQAPDKVELVLLGTGKPSVFEMKAVGAFQYETTVSKDLLPKKGFLRYYISVKNDDDYLIFPNGKTDETSLVSRRIYSDDRLVDDTNPYEVRVVSGSAPVCLFEAKRDWAQIVKQNRKDRIDLFPTSIPGEAMVHFEVNNLSNEPHNVSMRSYCRNFIEERLSDIESKKILVVHGYALNSKPCTVQLALLTRDGAAFGATLEMSDIPDKYELPLSELKQVRSVLLPRPYPNFQAYWFQPADKQKFEITDVESIQISIGPGVKEAAYDEKQGVAIAWITLE